MKKDQYGISLTFYAVLAFALVVLGQTLLGGLLLGFVIVAQKDEWLTRQAMQAFFLSLVSGFMSVVFGLLFDLASLTYKIPFVGRYILQYTSEITNGIIGFLGDIVDLVVLVFAIIAILRVMKGSEAKLPVLNGWANKACGVAKDETVKTTTEE